jgi:hypothetical protein
MFKRKRKYNITPPRTRFDSNQILKPPSYEEFMEERKDDDVPYYYLLDTPTLPLYDDVEGIPVYCICELNYTKNEDCEYYIFC